VESVPPAELSFELKQWIINEAQWVVPVMDYLRQDIGTFSALVVAAELKGATQGEEFFQATNPGGRIAWAFEAEQQGAKALLSTGQLQLCPTCCAKVLYFGDGQKLSWPIMATHECEGE